MTASASYGDLQIVVTGETHGPDHIGGADASRPRIDARVQAAAFDIPPVRSKPTRKNQYDEDDQDDANDTDAAMTVAVAVATEATTEAAKQEDDKYDDEYESE